MQYVSIKWASLKDHEMESWRILPAEKRQQFLLLHSALMTTLILSATRQNFSHFRACCVNAEFHQLHIGSAGKNITLLFGSIILPSFPLFLAGFF